MSIPPPPPTTTTTTNETTELKHQPFNIMYANTTEYRFYGSLCALQSTQENCTNMARHRSFSYECHSTQMGVLSFKHCEPFQLRLVWQKAQITSDIMILAIDLCTVRRPGVSWPCWYKIRSSLVPSSINTVQTVAQIQKSIILTPLSKRYPTSGRLHNVARALS